MVALRRAPGAARRAGPRCADRRRRSAGDAAGAPQPSARCAKAKVPGGRVAELRPRLRQHPHPAAREEDRAGAGARSSRRPGRSRPSMPAARATSPARRSSPAGCVYVGTNDGWVFALNADNGKVVWKREAALRRRGQLLGDRRCGKRVYFAGLAPQRSDACRKRRKATPASAPTWSRSAKRTGQARLDDPLARPPAGIRRLRQPGRLRADADDRDLRRRRGARRRGRPLRLPGLDGLPRHPPRAGAAQDLDDP